MQGDINDEERRLPSMKRVCSGSFGKDGGRVKAGILGGAFNPPHIGHIALAKAAMRELSLDCVVFVPSASPPHKRIEGCLSFDERLTLAGMSVYAISPEDLRLATERYAGVSGKENIERICSTYEDEYAGAHDPRFLVNDIERDLPAPTYTFDTVTAIKRKNPEWDISLIMGMDQAMVFDTWYRYEDLVSMAHICAATRPGFGDNGVAIRFPFITVFPFQEIEISSSEIRNHIPDDGYAEKAVPLTVLNLYRIMCTSKN
jgi:nicotinate-nucleotide adenylyltransferase